MLLGRTSQAVSLCPVAVRCALIIATVSVCINAVSAGAFSRWLCVAGCERVWAVAAVGFHEATFAAEQSGQYRYCCFPSCCWCCCCFVLYKYFSARYRRCVWTDVLLGPISDAVMIDDAFVPGVADAQV